MFKNLVTRIGPKSRIFLSLRKNRLGVINFSSDRDKESESLSILQRIKPNLMNGAMVAGGCVTIYGISTMVWDVTSLFINLTPASTGGMVTSSICAGLLYYTERWYTIRPQRIFRMSLGILNSDEALQKKLGHEVVGDLKPGKLRAFRQDGGYWTVVGSKLTWKKPRVQMIYDAYGAEGQSIITVEGSRSGFQEEIDFLSIDILNDSKSKTRILIKGSDDLYPMVDEFQKAVNFKKS